MTVTLDPQSTALILVDFLNLTFKKGNPAINAADTLLNEAREKGVLVVHTGIIVRGGGTDWVSSLAPRDGEPVVLGMPDKFHTPGDIMNGCGTGLQDILHSHHIKTLIIAGGSTSGGVYSTAMEVTISGSTDNKSGSLSK